MVDDIMIAYNKMLSENCTCVIYSSKKNKTYISNERGVKPLIDLINRRTNVKGFSAADRVVGKAAAFLYVKLGVEAVYAGIISKPAKLVLSQHNITYYANKTVPLIRNRAKTGYCPMESAVLDITDVNEAYCAIKKQYAALNRKK